MLTLTNPSDASVASENARVQFGCFLVVFVVVAIMLPSCLYRPPPGGTLLPLVPNGYQWTGHLQNAHFQDQRGNREKAIEHMAYACQAIRTFYRKEPREYTSCMILMGQLYYKYGMYWESKQAYRKAAPSARRWHNSWQSVDELLLVLGGLTETHLATGDLERAKTYAEEALRLARTKNNPLDSTPYINNLAHIQERRGDLVSAEALLLEAIDITEVELCLDHPDLLIHREDLGRVYWRRKKYREAKKIYQVVVSDYQSSHGRDHERLIAPYSHLGDIYLWDGELEKAESMLRSALDVAAARAREGGADDCARPEVVLTESWNFREWLDATSSGIWFRPSARVTRRCQDGDELVDSMHGLASIHMAKKEYHKARPLYEELLQLAAAGGVDRSLIDSMLELAELYALQGSIERADGLYARAYRLVERALPGKSERLTEILRARARLNAAHGRYDRAKNFAELALATDRKYPSQSNASISEDLDIVAEIYLGEGRPEQAIGFWQEAIAINEQLGRARARRLVRNYAGLGQAQLARGQHGRAMASFEEAISIGSGLPDAASETMPAHVGLVTERWLAGDFAGAQASLEQVAALEDVEITGLLAVENETRMLEVSARARHTVDEAVSLHLLREARRVPTERFATELVLNRKGVVANALANSYPMAHKVIPEDQQHYIDRALRARAKVSMFMLRGARRSKLGPGFVFGLQKARREQAFIESLIFERIRPLTPPAVTLEDVEARLGVDDVLLEFLKYVPFDPGAESEAGARYAVGVIRRDRVDWVDLGDAALIESAIRSFIQDLIGMANVEDSGADLYRLLFAPLKRYLAGSRRLFISPDGGTRRVSFAALPTGGGRYLLEDYDIHYLGSGRDLLRPWNRFVPAQEQGVAIANPTGSELPGTLEEAEAVRKLLGNVSIWRDSRATESMFRQLDRPWVLHVGTHGFSRSTAEFPGTRFDPMIFTGLKLATPRRGSRSLVDEADDGLLSAYEMSWLDLRGTQLVTLSACGSGLGSVEAGEGVLGVQRSIAIAGAQSIVMSLWNVSDRATPRLMEEFYRQLRDGRSRQESMRRAQLALREQAEFAHPYYWGPFVVMGEWGPLTPPRRGLGTRSP